MSPGPVASTIKTPSTLGKGAVSSISATAHQVGKPGRTQHLGNITSMSPHTTPRSGIGGGNPSAHAAGHYGKNPPAGVGGATGGNGIDPTAHGGVTMIRGGAGTMRQHIREGGLGPGPGSTPGTSADYSMNSTDVE